MARSMYAGIVDVLGAEIAAGTLTANSVVSLSSLEERFEVSRTVAREAMRSLEAKGMIEARRRVGLIVTDAARWRVLDPQVIGWRLAGPGRDDQLRSLTDLRVAVEPTAARLGATNATAAHRASLLELARRMRELGVNGLGRTQAFLDTDVEFHATVLRSSGNEMIIALEPVISAVLTGRSHQRGVPDRPDDRALASHEETAAAIAEGDAVAAEARSRHLVTMVRQEID
ncbi:MAG: FadR/GntR family transcriptional regulator [Actinomycetota bacterium]